MDLKVAQWVRFSLVFHNLNKRAESEYGLSIVQYYLLSTLRDMPGCSPLSLADAAGMHPSTLTQTLKRLSRKKAIFVGEDPKDSRKKVLSLTREGAALLRACSVGIESILDAADKPTRAWLNSAL